MLIRLHNLLYCPVHSLPERRRANLLASPVLSPVQGPPLNPVDDRHHSPVVCRALNRPISPQRNQVFLLQYNLLEVPLLNLRCGRHRSPVQFHLLNRAHYLRVSHLVLRQHNQLPPRQCNLAPHLPVSQVLNPRINQALGPLRNPVFNPLHNLQLCPVGSPAVRHAVNPV